MDKRWLASIVVLYAAAVTLPAMDRFFTWDGAIFWSQSGGLDGTEVKPLALVASWELGSPALIRLLRLVESDLAEVRYLWASLAFLLLAFGARRLVAHMSRYASPVMHVATGCSASLYSDWDDALVFAEENTKGLPQFIYGPAYDGHFEDLPDGWTVVPNGGFRFASWMPLERSN